ncbi:MAG: hypothetical protein IPK16_01580 [Anaerolineales bacterium]|nr:hypothetical protein [Anaerolineales bacterium]
MPKAHALTCNQIRAIGEALALQGGAARMQAIAALVGALGGDVRDLEFYWDGICGWLY